MDRLVLAEILPGEFVDVFAVDNWPEELFEQFVFPVGGARRSRSVPTYRARWSSGI